jgi:signal transduction histidine kinase
MNNKPNAMGVRILLILFVLLLSLQGQAAIPPSSDLSMLRDPNGSLNIKQVADINPALFKPLPTGTLTAGFSRDTFWLRLKVSASAGEWWLDVLPAVLDDLRLYEPDLMRSGEWKERRAGDMLPYSAREIPYRGFAFKLPSGSSSPRVYFLRLQTSSSSFLTTRLLSPAAFIARSTLETSLIVATIAVLLIVAILNVNNWLWLRDSVTPWFVAQMLCLAGYFFTSNGLALQTIWPNSPQLNYAANTIFVFLLICTGNGMFRRLFELDRHRQAFLFWFFEVSCWLPILGMAFALLGWQVEVMPFFLIYSILTNAVCIVVSVQLWLRRGTGSGALLAANLLTFAGIFVSIIQVMGLIPGGVYIWQSMQFSSLASILAIHVSLGARYRDLNEARQQAELRASWEEEQRLRQRTFLSMLTHELRNSLSVIGMAIGIQPMSHRSISKAQRAMNSLTQVIEHSVQADRLSDRQVEPDFQPCDVSQLVEHVIANCRNPDRIQARISPSLRRKTDSRLLRVIISNLLDNALKYGKAGTPIAVAFRESHGECCLSICNEVGPAGAPNPERVFEKYYREPKAHSITGSGLGLHIAAELARLLGCQIQYRQSHGLVCFECRL